MTAALLLVLVSCERTELGPADLVLLTLDTTRADHLGAYGATTGATPALDRLATEGVRFENALSPVPLTLPAHASLMTGLLPPRHGLRGNGSGALPETTAALATVLAAAGYRTGAFVAAFVLDRRFGLARGFETYDDEVPRDRDLESERPAREVVDRAIAWLARDDGRPLFLWVHVYEPHAPYEPPEPFRSRFASSPYDGELATADAELGRLLDAIAARRPARPTFVAVAGDHGEGLGEHGEASHGLLLYESTLRVPLLLAGPGLAPGGVLRRPVGLIDLAPTLAHLVGAAFPASTDGRDLAADLLAAREPAGADIYAETRYPEQLGWSPLAALRSGTRKYIAAPRPELYDLAADPHEQRNLLPGGADADPLPARLAALAGAAPVATPAPVLDHEARARLESLGYLGGPAAPGGRERPDPKDRVDAFRSFETAHAEILAGRPAAARERLEKLVADEPGNPVFLGQLAEACRRTGSPGRAIDLYRRALAANPDDREARYNLAVTLQEAGRLAEAVTALETAIWLDPGRPDAHNALGIALLARGDGDGARAQFARTVELDPRHARAWNNLGNLERERGALDAAEAAYRRSSEADAAYADPLNGLGALAVQRQRPAAAIAYFDRALTLAPTQTETLLNRAIAHELSGARTDAIADYREFLARSAGDPALAQQRHAARGLLGRLERGGS